MSCVRLNHEGRKNKSAEGLIQARVIRLRGGLIFFAVGGGGGGGNEWKGVAGLAGDDNETSPFSFGEFILRPRVRPWDGPKLTQPSPRDKKVGLEHLRTKIQASGNTFCFRDP